MPLKVIEQVLMNALPGRERTRTWLGTPAQVSQVCFAWPTFYAHRTGSLEKKHKSIGQGDLGFSKFCNTISPSSEKNLGWYGLDGWYIKWVKTRLGGDQIFICQWLIQGPILLKIFFENLDKGIGYTVLELSDDLRLRKVTDILDHNVKLGSSMPL